MEKITSTADLQEKYGHMNSDATGVAMTNIGICRGGLNAENFWQVREQCRINAGTYTPIHIEGDDKMRFLHDSVDDPAKVSYTKDADKGKQDIQTRTTLAAYCEKFGLDISTAATPEVIFRGDGPLAERMAREIDRMASRQAQAGKASTSVREKLLRIQDLIDEVLADLG